MRNRFYLIITVIMIGSIVLIQGANATPSVKIIMDHTTYKYCEKLFYTIEVSEITGDPAIIHIRDQAGKESNAIPVPIYNLQNPIPSTAPFEAEIFPIGKYFIDVEYSGAKDSAEFNLVDSQNICIPMVMKQIAFSWIDNKISDGFLIDAITRYVDKNLISIPDAIKEKNLGSLGKDNSQV